MAAKRVSMIKGFAIFVIVVTTAWTAWMQLAPPEDDIPKNVGLPDIPVGGPFTLVDHNGKTVTDKDFRGKLMLILFGYTYCPDVCPTSLGIMAEALDMLGAEAEKVTPIFITVDPKRDTVEQLKDYVPNFHPRLVGLTGTPEQITAVAKAYRIFFAKLNTKEGEDPDNYAMAHASFIFLMGEDGKKRTIFNSGTRPEEMAKEIKKFL